MKTTALLALLIGLFCPFLLGLSAGDPAPNISARNQNGKLIHLSDYRGKFILVYFYPKDETPGCTKEACSFRDEYAKIRKMNAVIFGVSRQDEKSHQKFIAHHHLPFDLLVDRDGSIAKAFGVGSIPILGLLKRESVLIGPDGKVIRFYDDVNPGRHAEEVLDDLRKAKRG